MSINLTASAQKKLIFMDNGNKKNFNIGSIGINSYINSMDIDITVDDEVINIQIGNYCSIANNILALVNRNHDYKSISTSGLLNFDGKRKLKQNGEIIIGNDVWIGNNVLLLSGIKIGNGAVIGAGTVVAKDVPPYAIVVGNSMRIIKYRFSEDNIQKLQSIQWWNWDIENIEKNKKWFSKGINEFTTQFYLVEKDYKDIGMVLKDSSILFYPDFSETYSVWKKVVSEYIDKFSIKDNISLILRIPLDKNFEQYVKMITDVINVTINSPNVLVVNDIIDDERSIFKNVNYFVTTRSINTIRHIEMAQEFNIKVLSGVDIPVFEDMV